MPQQDYVARIRAVLVDDTGAGTSKTKSSIESFASQINKHNKETLSFGDKIRSLFTQNNFLFRTLGRQVAGTTGFMAAGVTKLTLSFNDLNSKMKETGIGAKRALAEGIVKEANNLEKGLANAKNTLQSAEAAFVRVQGRVADRLLDFQARLKNSATLGRNVTAKSIEDWAKLRGAIQQNAFISQHFGSVTRKEFEKIRAELNKAGASFTKLGRDSARALQGPQDRIAAAKSEVQKFEQALGGINKKAGDFIAEMEEAAGAVTGMAGGVGLAVAGVAALVAGVVIAIAILTAFLALTFKATEMAGKYGDELYRTEKALGISAQRLSVINLLARESDQSFDSMARVMARLESNIDKALVKKTSQAGLAVKALGIDFDDLKKASPDDQIIMVAQGLEKMNNQNVKAHAASILLSRDWRKQAEVLSILAEDYAEAKKKVAEYGLEMDEHGVVQAHNFEVAIRDVELRVLGFANSFSKTAMPAFTVSINRLGELLTSSAKNWLGWGDVAMKAIIGVRVTLAGLAAATKGPGEGVPGIGGMIQRGTSALPGGFVFSLPERLRNMRQTMGDESSMMAKEMFEEYQKAEKEADRLRKMTATPGDDQFPTAPGRTKQAPDPARTSLKRLEDAIQEINSRAEEAVSVLDEQFRAGELGLEDYYQKSKQFEVKRHTDVLDIFQKETPVIMALRKRSAESESTLQKKQVEETTKNTKRLLDVERKYEDDRLKTKIDFHEELLKRTQDTETQIGNELERQSDLRKRTYLDSESTITKIRTDSLNNEISYWQALQNFYVDDSDKYNEFKKRKEAAIDDLEKFQAGSINRQIEAIQKDMKVLEEYDQLMRSISQESFDLLRSTNAINVDVQEKLGLDPKQVRRLRILTDVGDENERYRREQFNRQRQMYKDFINKSEQEKNDIKDQYRILDQNAEQEHQARLFEIMIEPLVRYEEKVKQIAESVAEVFGTAFADIGQKGQSFFHDLISGFNSLWKQIVHDFITSKVKNYVESLFSPLGSRNVGGAGGGFTQALQGLFGAGAAAGVGGGTPGFNPNASGLFFSGTSTGGNQGSQVQGLLRQLGLGGAGIGVGAGPNTPTSVGAGPGTVGSLGSLRDLLGLGGGSSTMTGSTGAVGGIRGFLAKNYSGLIAAGLGASAGIGLGGSSATGRILGGIGGAGAGLIGGALLGSASAIGLLTTIGGLPLLGTFGGTLAGAFGFAGTAAAGLFATAGIALPLIVGAIILSRNARRRADERTRDQLARDTRSQVYDLIRAVETDRMDGQDALGQYAQLRAQYLQQAGQIKDKKTRRNAELWINDLDRDVLPRLQKAANDQLERRARVSRMNPEFARGGFVFGDMGSSSRTIKVRPGETMMFPNGSRSVVSGVDRGYDSVFKTVPVGTRVFTRGQAVQGFAGGGQVGFNYMPINQSAFIEVPVEIVLDGEVLAKTVVKTNGFRKGVVHRVNVARKDGEIR